jgi:hypothetical protein
MMQSFRARKPCVSAWRRTIVCAAGTLFIAWALAEAQTVPDIPIVSGPIIGPGAMYPGLRPLTPGTEPADYGYLTNEYFVSGMANGQPYTTRILVRRPPKVKKFSGIVVSEVMHSNGFAVVFEPARHSILLRGHVHVEIAAQQTNVNTTIKPFNPERYAKLSIPSGAQTSEIIAQVGMLIKGNLMGGPLDPLPVRHLILMGTSQSSQVLRTYQSQQHFQVRMPDGSAIVDGYLATSTLGNAPMMIVDVPTVQMPTQTEVNSGAAAGNGYRRPDSDEPENRFRLYETAGQAHANSRDTVTYDPNPCQLPISDFPWGAITATGLHHLVEWVARGTIPPHAPSYIQVDNDTSNDGSPLALDEFGNALGGVRNTYVDVPVAQYGVPNVGSTPAAAFTCSIAGYRLPFSEDTLRSLYKNRAQYIREVNRRLKELKREGWFLPEYADVVRRDALQIDIPSARRK